MLRPATEAELPQIVAMVNRAYRGTGPTASWNTEAEFLEGERINLEALRADLAAHPEALLLTFRDEADGPLLGSVWLEPAEDGAWYLGMLNVDPEAQKRQLGRTLLAEVEEAAKERGARRIRMSVIGVRETLIAWYERRGYALTGESEPFPYGNERFGRPKRDDLEFLILEKVI